MMRAVRKRIQGICFLGVLLLCLPFAIAPSKARADENSTISAVRHGVVCVEVGCQLDDGTDIPIFLESSRVTEQSTLADLDTVGRGSGFFVGEEDEDVEYLITNHHVVETYLSNGSGKRTSFVVSDSVQAYLDGNLEGMQLVKVDAHMQILVYLDGKKDTVEASVVDSDEKADLALLKLEKPTDKRSQVPLLAPTEDMVGEAVSAVGYPGLADNPLVASTSSFGENDSSVSDGTIERILKEKGTNVTNVQISNAIKSGNSGGPLVLQDKGCVIGVCTKGLEAGNESLSYAIGIGDALPMLDRNKVPYTTWEPAAGVPVALIIGAVVGVLAIAGVVVGIILSRKKKTPKAGAGNLPAKNRASGGSSLPDDSGFRLQCVAGAGGRQRMMIPLSAPLVVGRNAQACGLVLPANTPGVSGRHCEVWVSNGAVYVKDLGSTHGTFVAPGRKLAAGEAAALRVGDEIWLGSNSERFQVSKKQG